MGDADKALLLSLVQAIENVVIRNAALTKLSDMHRIPAHVRDAFLACAKSDHEIVAMCRAKFRPVYDQVDSVPDLSKALQSLLSALQ